MSDSIAKDNASPPTLQDNHSHRHNVKFVRKEHKHPRHENGDKKGSPDLRYCELCISVRNGTGFCSYGDKCLFAHSVEQLRPREQHAKYKTSFCQNYHSRKYCPFGTRCTYIHDEFRIVNNNEVWLVSPSEGLVRIETGVPLSIVNATSAANNPSATAAVVAAATEAVNAASKEIEKNKEETEDAPESTSSDTEVPEQTEEAAASEPALALTPSTSSNPETTAPSGQSSPSAAISSVAQFSKRGKRSVPPRVEVATTPASAAAIAAAFGLRNVHTIAPGTSFVHESGVTVMTPYNAEGATVATPTVASKTEEEKVMSDASAPVTEDAGETADSSETQEKKVAKRPSASAQPFIPMAQKPIPAKPHFSAPLGYKVRKQPPYVPYMRGAPMDKHMMPMPPNVPRPRFSPGMPVNPHMMPMPLAYGMPMRRKPAYVPYVQPMHKPYNKQFVSRPKKTPVMPPTYSQIVSQNVPAQQPAVAPISVAASDAVVKTGHEKQEEKEKADAKVEEKTA